MECNFIRKIFTEQFNDIKIEWRDHAKVWCSESKQYLYHYDRPNIKLSADCGCIDENPSPFNEVKFYKNEKAFGILHRNTYRTSTDNNKIFIYKFFYWRNQLYLLFNSSYGEIEIYQVGEKLIKYKTFISDCFNDKVQIVDNGKRLLIYHWIWHPLCYYQLYDLDKFMDCDIKYKGKQLINHAPYGDGLDFFDFIDNADYFEYYFNAQFWIFKDAREWMFNKFGANCNNSIVQFNYADYDQFIKDGFRFPNIDYNCKCGECKKNSYLSQCACDLRKTLPLKTCNKCQSKYVQDICGCVHYYD
jgi:hypothetical protein